MAEIRKLSLRVGCKRDLNDIGNVVKALDFGTAVDEIEKALKQLPKDPNGRGEPVIPSFSAERIKLAILAGQVIVEGEWPADGAALVKDAVVLLAKMERRHVQLNRRDWESAAIALASLQGSKRDPQ